MHFAYKLEERVTETHRDSKGRTRTTTRWKALKRSSGSVPFRLRQGDACIHIAADEADFRHLSDKVDREGRLRHTVRYFPYPSELSAVGSVSEGKVRLENYGNIPQLVSVAKGFLGHEQSLLSELTALRSQAAAGGRAVRVGVEGRIADSVSRTIASVEDYPDLKAQPLTGRLVRELTAIEQKIAHGRAIYNEAVREYNDTVEKIPQVLIARLLGFTLRAFFSAPPLSPCPGTRGET